MGIPNPSSEWTQEERLELITYLAGQLHDYSQEGRPLIRAGLVYAITERVVFVATTPAKFLEGNREQILESFEELVTRYTRP